MAYRRGIQWLPVAHVERWRVADDAAVEAAMISETVEATTAIPGGP